MGQEDPKDPVGQDFQFQAGYVSFKARMAGVENRVSPRAVLLMSRTLRTCPGSRSARDRGGRRRTRRAR
jgi:hypothetical protein